MRIIEYVGGDGVKSTEMSPFRFERPRSGDLVRWPSGRLGRIWEVGGLMGEDKLHVCDNMGSAFLNPDGSVSISGGPFYALPKVEFRPTYELGSAQVWNWGDRTPGANQGVYYTIQRPIFQYVGDADLWYQRAQDREEAKAVAG